MADNVLQFDDGSVTLTLFTTDGPQIKWYPNDVNFVDRLSRFNAWFEEFGNRVRNLKGLKSLELDDSGVPIKYDEEYEVGSIEQLGQEFRDQLDLTFASSISAVTFGNINPISPTKSGGLVYENFLDAVMPIIEKSFDSFAEAREKYTNQFKNRAQRRVNS